jgi:Zn-dependent peptidase ImmA (M78 family)
MDASTPIWLQLRRMKPSTDVILRTFGYLHPPVDVFKIAERMQIEVVRYPKLQWAGALDSWESPPRAVLFTRAEDIEERQRFTVAHEIGHLMLHDLGIAYRDTTFHGDKAEAQANGYAAKLLVPLWMLDPFVMRHGGDVARLAEKFQVSQEMMRIRLAKWAGR